MSTGSLTYGMQNTLSKLRTKTIPAEYILSVIEQSNAIVVTVFNGIESDPAPIPITMVDVVGTIYLTFDNAVYTPTALSPIDNLTVYLPVSENEQVFTDSNITFNPLQHASFKPSYVFVSDFPIIDDTSTPNISIQSVSSHLGNGVFEIVGFPQLTPDAVKDFTGTIIYYDIQ